jgi:hypothetical protein
MNELFVQNTVPSVHETKPISNLTSIDLMSFLPIVGQRSFYDYTHSSNQKLNIKIYQTPLAISIEALNQLKTKLTPGNLYQNFRDAISLKKNPDYGLFFYFSQDLSQQYKKFQSNIKDDSSQKIKVVQEEETKSSLKESFDPIQEEEDKREEDKLKEPFDASARAENLNVNIVFSFGLIVTIVINILLFCFIHSVLNEPVGENETIDYYTLESNVKQFVDYKFKYVIVLLIQIIFVILALFYMYNKGQKKWSVSLYFCISIIFLLSYLSISYLLKYTQHRALAMNYEHNDKLSIIDSTENMLGTVFSSQNKQMSGGGNDNNNNNSPITDGIPPPPPSQGININGMFPNEFSNKNDTTLTILIEKITKTPYRSTTWILVGFIFFLFIFSCILYFSLYPKTIPAGGIIGYSILLNILYYFFVITRLYFNSEGKFSIFGFKPTYESIVSIVYLIIIFFILFGIGFSSNYELTINILFFSNYMFLIYIPFFVLLYYLCVKCLGQNVGIGIGIGIYIFLVVSIILCTFVPASLTKVIS